MNKKALLLIAAGTLLVLWILYKTYTVQRLNYSIGVPQQFTLKQGDLRFVLPFKIQNSSNGVINLKGVDFDVLSSGKFIGKAMVTQPTAVSPNAVTTLLVQVVIQYPDLLTSAATVWNTLRGGNVNLQLDGLVYAEGFQFPYKGSFDFAVPKF